MKTFDITFAVVADGHAAFPLDMLRYDRCFPASEADAVTAQSPIQKPRQVRLISPGRSAHWRPCEERWNSFGWKILSVTNGRYI